MQLPIFLAGLQKSTCNLNFAMLYCIAKCGYSSLVEHRLPKPDRWVRFPLSAPAPPQAPSACGGFPSPKAVNWGLTQGKRLCYNDACRFIGVWRSLVSRMVRDHEAAGSSPATPTIVVADCISFAAAFSFAKPAPFLAHHTSPRVIRIGSAVLGLIAWRAQQFCYERIVKQHGISFVGSNIGRMVGR